MAGRKGLRGSDPLTRPRHTEEAEVDFTNLIDCVLLLLIFFMVSEAVNSQKRLNFPEAKSSKEVDPRHATLVTIREPASAGEAPEYILGENTSTTSDLETVRQFIEKGAKDGNRTVLVRAEKRVLHKDVLGVAELLSTIDGTNLSIAIEEPR